MVLNSQLVTLNHTSSSSIYALAGRNIAHEVPFNDETDDILSSQIETTAKVDERWLEF